MSNTVSLKLIINCYIYNTYLSIIDCQKSISSSHTMNIQSQLANRTAYLKSWLQKEII